MDPSAPLDTKSAPTTPSEDRQTQSEFVAPQARVVVNNSRSNRRQSYQVSEKAEIERAREQAEHALKRNEGVPGASDARGCHALPRCLQRLDVLPDSAVQHWQENSFILPI